MKNKFKGFTLVELIIVMAIMSILMLAIMNMFKPIREIYVDSTQYESQRTAQNGVVQYVTESVRFATDMGVYNDVSTAQAAAKAFAEAYCDANGYDKTDAGNLNKIYKHVEIMIIDNKTTHYGKNFTGRLIRRKVDGTSSSVSEPAFSGTNNIVVPSATNTWRTALGEAYYGENTFYVTLDTSESADGMLTVNVVSTSNAKRDITKMGKETDTDPNSSAVSVAHLSTTKGGVLCRNLVSGSYGVSAAGIYDVNYTANNSKNAYIVFVNKDGKDAIEAEGLTS